MGLIQELQKADAERRAEIAELRSEVATQLDEYTAAHAAMADELHASLTEEEKARQQAAAEYNFQLQSDTKAQVDEYTAAHAAMADELHTSLTQEEKARQQAAIEYSAELRSEVAELKSDTIEYSAELRSEVAQLQSDTKAQVDEYTAAHAAMADELHASLTEEEKARQQAAAEYNFQLQSDTKAQVDEYTAAHAAMADELHASLTEEEKARQQAAAEYNFQLQSDTKAQLREYAEGDALRRAEIWGGAAPTVAPPPVKKVAPRAAEEVVADDLTAIRGIGPATAGHLNEAGFNTYTQLARAVSADLRKAMGEAGQRINVEEWIEQAQELAGLG